MLSLIKPKKREEGVQNLQYETILESSFIYYIVGKPGSGKTHLISQLLARNDIYKDKFNTVILIAPQRNLECNHYINSLNMKEIWTIFKEFNATQQSNILLVFDDVISQIHDNGHNIDFQNLVFNRRNILPNTTISIIFTSQKYVLLPSNIRSCVSMLFFFQMMGNDLIRIKNEWIKTPNEKLKLEEALKRQNEFDFISIRTSPYQIRISFVLIENLKDIIDEVQSKSVVKIQTNQIPKKKNPPDLKNIHPLVQKTDNTPIKSYFSDQQTKKPVKSQHLNSLYNLI